MKHFQGKSRKPFKCNESSSLSTVIAVSICLSVKAETSNQ